MRIRNLTQRKVVARRAKAAKNFFERLRGLIGRPRLKEGEALWIPHCQGIHTFGMRYAIDVVFLDKKRRVVRAVQKIRPNVFGPTTFRADSALELPSGTIREKEIREGDCLSFIRERAAKS